jgi:deoxyribodipyrimidine photo-lyase
MSKPALVWFRDDLRLRDHPALSDAVASGAPVTCVYIHDEETEGKRPLGAAQKWFLHHGLNALSDSLNEIGGKFHVLSGKSADIILNLVEAGSFGAVYWNRRSGKTELETDQHLKNALTEQGVEVKSYQGNLLHEPYRMETSTGGPYRVYTPFWRAISKMGDPREPLPAPDAVEVGPEPRDQVSINSLQLLPNNPDWASEKDWDQLWQPGEAGAEAALKRFLDGPIDNYADGRDIPSKDWTSRLSPYLRFGMISPYTVWHATRHAEDASEIKGDNGLVFRKELVWREFSYHILFHFPDISWSNFQEKFDDFPWSEEDSDNLQRWQKGLTGYPIVDAGMRQLWQTGYMHNRVRMIVGSFLVKHLLIHWRKGEAWFWDTLVDADPANNAASWQWVAGSGADAAPYFRVFNPILQGEKFDKKGDYVRAFVPELANLPDTFIHKPWEAPNDALRKADVKLGETYPDPVIQHKRGRERALEAFEQIKKAS